MERPSMETPGLLSPPIASIDITLFKLKPKPHMYKLNKKIKTH